MQRPVSLEELRAILVVGQTGSIAAAAKGLSVRQQDLRRVIHRLEKKLGSALLIHDGDAVRMTSAGKLIVANSDRVLAHLREAAEQIHASASMLKLLMIPAHGFPTTVTEAA